MRLAGAVGEHSPNKIQERTNLKDKRTTTSPVDVAQAIAGAPFPCTREKLLGHARRMGATEEALDTLLALPDLTYRDASEVMKWVRG